MSAQTTTSLFCIAGDHVYKRRKDLPPEEQMITALPDVETTELCNKDQFIVIACDGIW